MHFGIDLYAQNNVTDPSALYAALKVVGGGAEPFVIDKATEGVTFADPDYAERTAAFAAAGFVARGAYFFDHGNDNYLEEIDFYLAHVGQGTPTVKDIETPGGLTMAQYAVHVAELDAALPGLNYLNQSEVACGIPQGDGLYLADYNGEPGTAPYPCVIHQYTSTGSIPGVAGHVDLDVWVGTDAQFDAFFHLTPPPPPPPPPPPAIPFEGDPQLIYTCSQYGQDHIVGIDFDGNMVHDSWTQPNPGAGIKGGWGHEILLTGCDPSKGCAGWDPKTKSNPAQMDVFAFAVASGARVHAWYVVGQGWHHEVFTTFAAAGRLGRIFSRRKRSSVEGVASRLGVSS